MVKIPTYEARYAAQAGPNSVKSSQSPDTIASSSLTSLGQNITNLGQTMVNMGIKEAREAENAKKWRMAKLEELGRKLTDTQIKEAKTWSAVKMATISNEITQIINDAQLEAGPGAPDYTQSLTEKLDQYFVDQVNAAPNKLSGKFLEEALIPLQSRLVNDAIDFEGRARNIQTIAELESSLDVTANELYDNPSNWKEKHAIFMNIFDSLKDDLTPDQEIQLKELINNKIVKSVIDSMMEKDPDLLNELLKSGEFNDYLPPESLNRFKQKAKLMSEEVGVREEHEARNTIDGVIDSLYNGDDGVNTGTARNLVSILPKREQLRYNDELDLAEKVNGHFQVVKDLGPDLARPYLSDLAPKANDSNYQQKNDVYNRTSAMYDNRLKAIQADPIAHGIPPEEQVLYGISSANTRFLSNDDVFKATELLSAADNAAEFLEVVSIIEQDQGANTESALREIGMEDLDVAILMSRRDTPAFESLYNATKMQAKDVTTVLKDKQVPKVEIEREWARVISDFFQSQTAIDPENRIALFTRLQELAVRTIAVEMPGLGAIRSTTERVFDRLIGDHYTEILNQDPPIFIPNQVGNMLIDSDKVEDYLDYISDSTNVSKHNNHLGLNVSNEDFQNNDEVLADMMRKSTWILSADGGSVELWYRDFEDVLIPVVDLTTHQRFSVSLADITNGYYTAPESWWDRFVNKGRESYRHSGHFSREAP